MAYPLSGTRRRSLSQARLGARGELARDVRGAPAPSTGNRVSARGSGAGDPEEGVSVRASVRVWECARMYAPGAPGRTVQLFSCVSLCFLAPSSLSLTGWSTIKRKGGKGFQKKLIAKRR